MCVCVAADAPANRRISRRYLTKLQVKAENITDLVNGREAYDFITAPDSHWDLMLMDIEMPEMNGDEVMGRSQPRFPVVAMTGNASLEDRTRFLSIGFRSVLPKPFEVADLKEVMAKCVGPHLTQARTPARSPLATITGDSLISSDSAVTFAERP